LQEKLQKDKKTTRNEGEVEGKGRREMKDL
jgi:hypothetical protein